MSVQGYEFNHWQFSDFEVGYEKSVFVRVNREAPGGCYHSCFTLFMAISEETFVCGHVCEKDCSFCSQAGLV